MEMETNKKEEFEIKLRKLLDDFGFDLYAANIVMENGEVVPSVKIAELNKKVENKNEDTTKERPASDKKA